MRRYLAVMAVVLVAALPAGGRSPAAHAADAGVGTDWLTFGDSPQRDGENPAETVISPANVGALHQVWSRDLGAGVDNSPVEAAGVRVGARSQNLVLVGSEHGIFVALNAATGATVVQAYNKPPLGAGSDLDFGSTPVLFQAPGCPPQLAVENKNGALYLYDQSSIGAGPVQRIQLTDSTLIGVAAWSSRQHLLFAADPADSSKFSHGMVAFSDPSPSCTLATAWNARVPDDGVPSPPIVANGVVYYGAGNVEYALNAATGAVLWTSGSTITAPIHGAAVVVNGVLYVPSWDHHLHAFAP
jgi:outer membrane protein assembly factor BamB